MTALLIIGILFLIILIMLLAHIRAEVKIYDGELDFKVNYLFLTLYPLKERKLKKKLKKQKPIKEKKILKKEILPDNQVKIHDEKEVSSEKIKIDEYKQGEEDIKSVSNLTDDELLNPDKPVKEKLTDKLDDLIAKWGKIKLIYESSKKGLKRIYKGIRIDDIIIDFKTADEDAYNAAMKYGEVSAATYNAVSALRCFFSISVISVDINCIFNSSESSYEGEFKLRMSAAVLLSAGMSILLAIFKNRKQIFDK